MTLTIGAEAVKKVAQRFSTSVGINASLAAITAAAAFPLPPLQIQVQNLSADLAERVGGAKYPVLHIYCDKIINDLAEKFRTFSGRVLMALELRHSQDRLEGLQDALEMYVDAATQVLDASRGDWGNGMFYGGGYQVTFSAVKPGGKHFLQAAKVTFEIGVSRS
jgi:hypothetical protein